MLATAQDHKRAFDGDAGPNTGGMGAYSPVPFVGADVVDEVMERALFPTLAELERRGAPYRGVLFCGLMLTPAGVKVLEYNVRFGDPECQVLVPRFASDLFVHLSESAAGELSTPIELSGEACVGVVLAAAGYPPAPDRKGDVIAGLDGAGAHDGVAVFHSGTTHDDQGRIVTNGGRVLTVTAVGADVRAGARHGPTRPRRRSRGPASTTVVTSELRPSRDPPLLPSRDVRAVHRRSAVRRVARGRDPRGRGVGGARCRRRRGRARRSANARASTWPRSTSASGSPTTTSPRSSTSCRNGSGRPRVHGCTTASRRATSSTRRSRSR